MRERTHRSWIAPVFLLFFLAHGCGPQGDGAGGEASGEAGPGGGRIASEAVEAGLEELVRRMTGSFSSRAQSLRDTAFFDIRLEMVRIWPDRGPGFWLYVEQAEAAALDQPYRQRVYHVTAQADGSYRSEIFSLPGDPLGYAGAWRLPDPLDDLTPDELEVRTGCAVVIHRSQTGDFVGSTVERECTSSLRGATYATTEVEITAGTLVSWDRGFDDAGQQVWGSESGGYVFEKEGA